MTIAFRDGSVANSASSQVSSLQLVLPSTLQGGDVVLILATSVPISSTTATLTASSTGTTPLQQGSPATGSEPIPATVTGTVFSIICAGSTGTASSDAGATVTISASTSGFMALACAAWSGVANGGPVDVISGAFGGASTATVTCPVLTTTLSGDWAIFLGGGAAEGGGLTPPTGSTLRKSTVSGSDVAAVIADSNAGVGASGTSIGGGNFTTASATNSILVGFTVGLVADTGGGTSVSLADKAGATDAISVNAGGNISLPDQAGATDALSLATSPAFNAVLTSTDGNGVQTWTVTSSHNGPTTSLLRILPPSSPSSSYPHSFLYMLPVVVGHATTNGDPISVVESLDACNTYNTTAVVPEFPIDPWYANNPVNQQQQQEQYMLDLAAFMATSSFATTGSEKNYLIGFSKSGIGGQGLIFHRPDVWAACASWDAPFMMTSYDGQDPTFGQTVGGNSANSYGTAANFTNNYQLSTTNLTRWANASNFKTVNRLWIGGYFAFQADVNAYKTLLSSLSIQHTEFNSLDSSHAWLNDWVGAAIAALTATNIGENDFAGATDAISISVTVGLADKGAAKDVVSNGNLAIAAHAYGGTATIASTLGGTVSTGAPLGGSLTVTVNTLSGTAVEDTMQEVDIILNSFNDMNVAFALTSSGSPLNLTGTTVNLYLKPNRGMTDGSNGVVKLSSSGASPAINITNATGGLCTALISATIITPGAFSFYRVDIVNSSNQTSTAIFGTVAITAL